MPAPDGFSVIFLLRTLISFGIGYAIGAIVFASFGRAVESHSTDVG
jgi:hypothetical protein